MEGEWTYDGKGMIQDERGSWQHILSRVISLGKVFYINILIQNIGINRLTLLTSSPSFFKQLI